jgi:hypothetical protein
MINLLKFAAVIMAASLATSAAQARGYGLQYSVNKRSAGCLSMVDINQITALRAAGNPAAAQNYFLAQVALGQCRIIGVGRVTVVGPDDDTYICVRKPNYPVCFHLIASNVTKVRTRLH